MKELLQVVDVEKCIALGKRRVAFLIIVSILMIDAVNAMEDKDYQRVSFPRSSLVTQSSPTEDNLRGGEGSISED